MKKYNISKPEKYTKDGVEKTFWANIGTMTEFEKQDGSVSRILEIPAISLKANIFPIEQKKEPNRSQGKANIKDIPDQDMIDPRSGVNTEDIPF